MAHLRSRLAYVLLLVSLGAAAAIGIVLPVAGLLTGGTLRANFAIALIIVAVLIDFAVLSSYGTSLRMQQVARMAWLLVAAVCLIFTQYVLNLNYTDAGKAADTVLIIVMFSLAFPAGTIATGLTILYSILMANRAMNAFDLMVLWFFFVVCGYLQWFKLIPFLVSKLGTKVRTKSKTVAPS